jgi:hypothetical protein
VSKNVFPAEHAKKEDMKQNYMPVDAFGRRITLQQKIYRVECDKNVVLK